MNKGKLFFAALGGLVLYFVAAGGLSGLDNRGFFEVLAGPLARSNPLDMILAMAAIVLIAFAALPSDQGLGRTTLLRGISLSSALITTLCAAAIIALANKPHSELVGVFAMVMISQAFVGLTAATLLVIRRGDRRVAAVPILLNGGLAVAAVALFFVPMP